MGSPGSGATLAARHWSSWDTARPWDLVTQTEATMIHQLAWRDARELSERPFRAPHYSVSEAGLCGSMASGRLRAGEASLAHGGILYLDEIQEFRTSVLDALWCVLGRGAFEARDYSRLPAAPALVIGSCNPESVGSKARLDAIVHRFVSGKIGPA